MAGGGGGGGAVRVGWESKGRANETFSPFFQLRVVLGFWAFVLATAAAATAASAASTFTFIFCR
jgi:hypothetical protein